ncbi:MAG: hypothetical protein HY764_03540 [Candidatus Portnoybacteria bacterium]|nr:hypothetical protein [Candidatus Portnoybacteria bacterium]
MKKIILSLSIIAAAAAVVIGVTTSFFSDTETSSGNTFTAGDIDLQIDNESYVTNEDGILVASPNTSWDLADLTIEKFFDFDDLKPGDIGEDTISIHIGSNDAWVCAAARITADEDVTCTEPEGDDDSNCAESGAGLGELDEEINFAFWVDDGDNVLEDNEVSSIFLEGPLSGIGAQGQITLADFDESILPDKGPIPGDETFHIGKAWCFGDLEEAAVASDNYENGPLTSVDNGIIGTGFTCDGAPVDNAAQTDMVMGDLQFFAVQSRNNPDFDCEIDYIPEWPDGQQLPPVGANLDEYNEPTLPECDHTASPGTYAAEYASAGNGDIICLTDGVYDGPIVIAKEIALVGVNGPLTSADINGVIEIAANNVTIKGLNIAGGVSSAPDFSGIYVHANTSGHTLRDNLLDGSDTASSRGILFGFNVSNTLVTNNVIENWTTGSYVNPTAVGNIDFTFNDFNSNVVGIGSDGMNNADITRNQFSGNTAEAIGASDDDGNVTGNEIHENNFIPAGVGNNVNVYEVEVLNTLGPIDAENNWWDGELEALRTNFPLTVDTDPAAAAIFPHN